MELRGDPRSGGDLQSKVNRVARRRVLRALRELDEGRLVRDVCEELGISRRTLHRLRARYVAEGLYQRLRDRQRSYRMRDLVLKTGLQRKTIADYMKRELVPRPVGLGSNAFYSERHLTRLRLLTLLKRGGVPQKEWPEFLARLGSNDESALVRSAGRLAWSAPRIREWIQSQRRSVRRA